MSLRADAYRPGVSALPASDLPAANSAPSAFRVLQHRQPPPTRPLPETRTPASPARLRPRSQRLCRSPRPRLVRPMPTHPAQRPCSQSRRWLSPRCLCRRFPSRLCPPCLPVPALPIPGLAHGWHLVVDTARRGDLQHQPARSQGLHHGAARFDADSYRASCPTKTAISITARATSTMPRRNLGVISWSAQAQAR